MNAWQTSQGRAAPTAPDTGVPPDAAPYLPPSLPTAAGATVAPSAASMIDPAPTIDQSGGAPFVPAPMAAPPLEPMAFDAKSMVDSQKRVNANPAYGALPTGTEASREATRKLRARAQRKRTRNKLFGRVLAVLLLVVLAAGGWFGYQAYQDEQERNAADASVREQRDAEEILEDLGSQGEMINAQDALNDAVVGRASGLGGAIDSAREVVGDVNGDVTGDPAAPAGDAAPTPFTYDVVVPPIVRTNGERLPDATGRETYVIDADAFAQSDPDAYELFVSLMGLQPQLIPEASAFDDLPTVAPGQIIISVVRNGDRIERAIVVGESVALRVDVTP